VSAVFSSFSPMLEESQELTKILFSRVLEEVPHSFCGDSFYFPPFPTSTRMRGPGRLDKKP
jgi:hypothetical protein